MWVSCLKVHNKMPTCFHLFWHECFPFCLFLSHRRSHLTNLCREGRTHSLTRCVYLTWTHHQQYVLSFFFLCHPNLAVPLFYFGNGLTSHSLLSLLIVFTFSWSAPWVLWQSTACRPSWGLCLTGTRGRTAWKTSPTNIDPGRTPSQKSERTQTAHMLKHPTEKLE